MEILCIAGVIAFAALLFVWYIVSREFSAIAAEKGYPDRRYFRFCFWLGLVGMLMVIALPDRGGSRAPAPPARGAANVPVAFSGARETSVKSSAPRSPRHFTAAAANPWNCSCGRSNIRSRRCPSCWAWLCSCGTMNPAQKATCDSCGAVKP